MRRIANTTRDERPEPVGPVSGTVLDGRPWGFCAVDGLPDLEAAPPYSRSERDLSWGSHPSDAEVTVGIDDEVIEALTQIHRCAEDLEAARLRRRTEVGRRELDGRRDLTVYELEVCDAMTVRRDAAIRLQQVLADDVSMYDCGVAGARSGLVLDLLAPNIAGVLRRGLSDVLDEFEAARHRFRLALVAVALDNGMTVAQIGQAFDFSRQLASRYLKEARERWPELEVRSPRLARVD